MPNHLRGCGQQSPGPADPEVIRLFKRYVAERRGGDTDRRGRGMFGALAEAAHASLAWLRLHAGVWRHKLARQMSIKIFRAAARVNIPRPVARDRRRSPPAKVSARSLPHKSGRRPMKPGPYDAA